MRAPDVDLIGNKCLGVVPGETLARSYRTPTAGSWVQHSDDSHHKHHDPVNLALDGDTVAAVGTCSVHLARQLAAEKGASTVEPEAASCGVFLPERYVVEGLPAGR
jgi:hypothetical protein